MRYLILLLFLTSCSLVTSILTKDPELVVNSEKLVEEIVDDVEK